MSRAGNLVGTFEIVDQSTAKDGRRPWTAEDAARLSGTFKIGGRATKPHVNTPAGPYVIGSVSLWCMRTVGTKTSGAPIACARRKSRAKDAACTACGGAA